MDIWTVLQSEWAMRALIASMLVGVTCGVLGCFIVLRNMALIGDALSHAILPGVVVAFIIVGYNVLGFFVGSVLAGLLAAVGITWIQQNVKTKNDAAIGIVFTAMFSLGVMGISWISKNEGVHLDLKDFLFGNVLGVSNQDLYLTAGIAVYVLLSVVVFYRYLFVSTFQPVIAETMGISVKMMHYFLMLLLSFVVVASLQTVGVILVVAMLITPAATALLLTNRLRRVLVVAGFIGFLSAVSGLLAAIYFNTTPGPAMAVVASIFYLVAALFAPEKGLVFRSIYKWQLRRRIHAEDVLKQGYRLQQKHDLSESTLQKQLGFNKAKLQQIINRLQKAGFYRKSPLQLTEKGRDEAIRLIRAHRLWETYLSKEVGLTEEQIHEEAEKYEHLLPDELLDEVDRQLGYPVIDPHGSPIPARKGQPKFTIAHLKSDTPAIISKQQINDHIATRLWQLGLLPGEAIKVVGFENGKVQIEHRGTSLDIAQELAAKVSVELAQPQKVH